MIPAAYAGLDRGDRTLQRWREDSQRLHRRALEDGSGGRIARRKLAVLLRASRKAELGYIRALTTILRAVHRGVLAHLERHLEAPELRHDKVEPAFLEGLLVYAKNRTGTAFDKMAKDVQKKNARTQDLLGIKPKNAGVAEVVAKARNANIELVERAGRAYADDVREVFDDPENFGKRPEILRDKLLERGNVSVSRATLIAKDQTLKLNAAISQAKHQAAGITRYRWSTSHDERVRASHAELDGQEFSYDDPPETDDDGDTNNPGEDFQCRCCAIPILDAAEESEDIDAAAE